MKLLVEALQYCRGKGIINRDIRIDNILLPPQIKYKITTSHKKIEIAIGGSAVLPLKGNYAQRY